MPTGFYQVPSALLYPNMSRLIVQTALPAQIGRGLLQPLPTGGSNSVTVPIEQGDKGAVASRLGPGDEIPLDVAAVLPQTVTVYPVGRGHFVPNDFIRYPNMAPLAAHYMIRLGLVLGNTVDYDIMQTIDAALTSGVGVNTPVACSGTSLYMNGEEQTLGSTLGQYDITDAQEEVRLWNYEPDTLAVNPPGLKSVGRLPHYSGEFLGGVPAYVNGERGQVEGMRVVVSNNVPSGVAYVLTSGVGMTPLGQYSPLGFFCEGFPIVTTPQDAPQKDGYNVYGLTQYAPIVVKSAAGCQLTY